MAETGESSKVETDPGAGFRARRLRALVLRASGELALIVLGVSVALWADGLVAARNDRATEKARVSALAENVETTLANVRAQSSESDSAVAALRYLAQLESPAAANEIRRALAVGFLYVPVFHAELNVYEDLKSSGELSLLRNAELRRALSALDSQLAQLQLAQQDMATVQQLNYDPYLIGRIDLRGVLGEYLALDPAVSDDGLDFSFVRSVEFRNLVLFKLDLTTLVSRQFDRLEAALLAVEQAMSAQLAGR